MPLIEEPEKAVRLARAIASDIALYNEEKIKQGIEGDNFYDSLSAELDEGRELYQSRVSPTIVQGTNFYDRAIVDIIIRSKSHIKSNMW